MHLGALLGRRGHDGLVRPLDRRKLSVEILHVVVNLTDGKTEIIGRKLAPQQGRLNLEDPSNRDNMLAVGAKAGFELIWHPVCLCDGLLQVESTRLQV